MVNRIPIVLVPLAVALVLGGCGGSGSGSSGSGAAIVDNVRVLRVIDVHETDFALSPKVIRVERFGYYGIRAVNDGEQAHALAIDGPSVKKQTGEIEPGKSAPLLVFFKKAGTYTLFCPLDSHEQKGMKATIKVH